MIKKDDDDDDDVKGTLLGGAQGVPPSTLDIFETENPIDKKRKFLTCDFLDHSLIFNLSQGNFQKDIQQTVTDTVGWRGTPYNNKLLIHTQGCSAQKGYHFQASCI